MRKSTTKTTTLKSLDKEPTVIEGKRVVKPDINPQALIDKAVEEAEQMDKEQALLERELQKPMKQRNKALLDKYNVLDSGKTLDNYPNLNRGVNYEMIIQFPEEDDIALEARPSLKEWYVGLRLSYKGNIFNYRFPIHYSTFHDGQQLYKLDGFSVYVDPDGIIRNELSEYTIFQALTDYSARELRNGQVNEMFYRYGIITDEYLDDDILKDDVPKDFAIKGVYVTSKAIKATESTTVPDIKSGKELVHPFIVASDINIPKSLKQAYNKDLDKMKREGGVVVPGLTTVLPKDVLVIDMWSSVKTVTKSTSRYVFLVYDSKQPLNILCRIIIGSDGALNFAKGLNPLVTRTTIQEYMIENNKAVLNRYNNNIEAERKKKEEEDMKYIKKIFKGVKQMTPPMSKPKRVYDGNDKDTMDDEINQVDEILRDDGFVINGVNKQIDKKLENYISEYHASNRDKYPSYIALLVRDDATNGKPRVKTIVFMGFSSLKKYLNIENVSDREAADIVVKHNNSFVNRG